MIDLINLCSIFGSNFKYKYILTCIDSYSKFAMGELLENKTMETVSNIIESIFLREGPPKILHTDNGSEFVNSLMIELCKNYKILHLKGTPYTLRVQGQIERFNKTLKEMINQKRNCFTKKTLFCFCKSYFMSITPQTIRQTIKNHFCFQKYRRFYLTV